MSGKSEKFIFILGSFPELSAAEIAAVLNLQASEFIFEPPLFIVNKKVDNPEELINRLGGTIKIAKTIEEIKGEDAMIERLVLILGSTAQKIIFGLNLYSSDAETDKAYDVGSWGKKIKKSLRLQGKSSRYIFKNQSALSSASVTHNDLLNKGLDIIIIKKGNDFIIGQTIAVQPFEEWGYRDFGRPSRDDFSGMLPPKVARMMINLSAVKPESSTLLDPFCGSGTIITEAAFLNFKKIIASDISKKAVDDTNTNLNWLKKQQNIKANNIIINQANATSLNIVHGSVDAIVTEPYLGPPRKGNENEKDLINISAELKILYSKALKNFSKILSRQGKIIMIIPRFKLGNRWLTIDISNEITRLGLVSDPLLKTKSREYGFLLYARPNQRVGREIWRLKKSS